jgi:hypothetical protein
MDTIIMVIVLVFATSKTFLGRPPKTSQNEFPGAGKQRQARATQRIRVNHSITLEGGCYDECASDSNDVHRRLCARKEETSARFLVLSLTRTYIDSNNDSLPIHSSLSIRQEEGRRRRGWRGRWCCCRGGRAQRRVIVTLMTHSAVFVLLILLLCADRANELKIGAQHSLAGGSRQSSTHTAHSVREDTCAHMYMFLRFTQTQS